mmetsp:Transcript_35841/g.65084  ORF Transcript_35841/g.65084 Transcript_35841/m.65084 type:complete len:213 (+) Transcript_35841:166-804(+)
MRFARMSLTSLSRLNCEDQESHSSGEMKPSWLASILEKTTSETTMGKASSLGRWARTHSQDKTGVRYCANSALLSCLSPFWSIILNKYLSLSTASPPQIMGSIDASSCTDTTPSPFTSSILHNFSICLSAFPSSFSSASPLSFFDTCRKISGISSALMDAAYVPFSGLAKPGFAFRIASTRSARGTSEKGSVRCNFAMFDMPMSKSLPSLWT